MGYPAVCVTVSGNAYLDRWTATQAEDATAEKAVPFRCAVLDLFVR